MKIYIVGTFREYPGTKHDAITGLRSEYRINGKTDSWLSDLKKSADQGILWVKCPGFQDAQVEIFWSDRWRRWVARTNRDTTVRNNLDHLPIVGTTSRQVYAAP